MSEISIQVRRVTERVKQYYTIFGLRPYARMRPGRSIIRGSKRLGLDDVECVVAETSRGTSVGFYSVNQLQSVIYSLPLMLTLLLVGLSRIDVFTNFLTGINAEDTGVNFVRLFTGAVSFDFMFIAIFLSLITIITGSELLIQKIRLDNLKARFSFYTRDAIWQTREIPSSIISLMTFRTTLMHTWLLAILYFGIFAFPNLVITDLSTLYNSDREELISATVEAFSITVGLIIGLVSAHKAIELRREYGKYDERTRLSGSRAERRYDTLVYGVQAAITTGILVTLFLSVTFFDVSTAAQISQFLVFTIIGGVIAGLVHQEGTAWVMGAYAIFIFFSSLVLIFRTGTEPAFAYVVVLQLFFVPIPFIIIAAQFFQREMKRSGVTTKEWLYDTVPIMAFLTLYLNHRKKQTAQREYEESLKEEISTELIDTKISLQKDYFQDPSSFAYKMVKHYFELIFTYTASFDEDQLVIIPTPSQLNQWWSDRSNRQVSEKEDEFIDITDRLLWDPSYLPKDSSLGKMETVGKDMVLAIQ